MPTFETPEPISVRIETGGGSVRLVATDRADTVVVVLPSDESRNSDVGAAEHTRVDFNDGTLVVTNPKRGLPLFRGGGDVDVEIVLPARSRVHASLGSADMRGEGEFTDFGFVGSSGDVEVDVVKGKVKADNASGSLTVRALEGSASLTTASGYARIKDLDGEVKFKGASGSLTVDRLRGDVRSQTASGSVTIAEAVRGTVSAHTSSGEVVVGVIEGTAVRLDIVTASGAVTNRLRPADGPEQGDETLVLGVRSSSGDVTIRRASPVREPVSPVPTT
jgi:hypothetical protein